MNPATLIDGYKTSHHLQYPKGTEVIVSNFTARKTRRPNVNKVVFFGLQYFIKKYLIEEWNKNFFQRPLEEVSAKFKRRINNYLLGEVDDTHIAELHAYGRVPLEIFALPEGTEHPLRVPSSVVYNIGGPKFSWFTNYIETIFSTTVWGPCTSATTAHQYKKLLRKFALETVGDDSFVQRQGHDFSCRGMFGLEAAVMSGAAHLISFTGSDTVPAIDFLEEYYNADSDKELVAGSVPATEHSVSCIQIMLNGRSHSNLSEEEQLKQGDIDYIREMMRIHPDGIVSIVSDSFDYWNTICNTSSILKDEILARNGKVVFRPDTGNPVRIVCGYKGFDLDTQVEHDVTINLLQEQGYEVVKSEGIWYEIVPGPRQDSDYELKATNLTDAEVKGSIQCLWDIFGGTVTSKGYKLLDSHVGLIYGDSITLERAEAICQGLKDKGFASINIVFGIGSFTYQYVTRDTDGYAIKATWAQVNGEEIAIYKKPKTDDGTKNSAKGLVAVFKDENGEFYLKDEATWGELQNCEFQKVFSDGSLLIDDSLDNIRKRLASYV